ncbi:phosphate starvation-inducible protein PsiF [Oxalobacteraceae bacterium CAVE-383]|nr:phosphate starvation-inducible protein PsiF [Oxalobacteraceae bacterium CAVE-383]
MKKSLAALAMLLPLFFGASAFAANAQQTKMATCNKDATGKKGDERKAFMKQCLSAKADAPAAAPTQQEKMKTCAASNKGKKGDDYKSSMKQCLSNKG